MQKASAKYWKLYDSDGSLIGEQQDADCGVDKAVELLEEALEEINEGWVTVNANTKKGKELSMGGDIKTGAFKFKIRMGGSSGSSGRDSSGNHYKDFFELKLEFEKFKLEKEYEGKNKDANKDPYEKFLEKIGNIVEIEYLEERKIQRGGKEISGTTTTTTTSVEKEKAKDVMNSGTNKEKVVAALTDLASVDSNIADNLLKLAEFAKKNPELYKQYVATLS